MSVSSGDSHDVESPGYFCKDLVTGYLLYLVKNSISKRHPFSNSFYYPHLVAMGLTSREIRVCKEWNFWPFRALLIKLKYVISIRESSSVYGKYEHSYYSLTRGTSYSCSAFEVIVISLKIFFLLHGKPISMILRTCSISLKTKVCFLLDQLINRSDFYFITE